MTNGWLARARSDAGQAVVLVGLALPVLLAGGGLGIDAGLQFVERRQAQVAADAAAYAAAVAIATNWSASDRATKATNAAMAYALANGYDDLTNNTVTVNVPPTSGAYSGNAAYAEVKISATVRTAFIRIAGSQFQTVTVSARAVGGVSGPPTPYSIIALSKTASPGFSATGNAEIEAEGAGILVNSSAATAMSCTNNAEIEVDTGGFNVVGGASVSCGADPQPTTGTRQQRDPLAYLTRPDGTGMTTYAAVSVASGTTTIQPGIYPSISVSGNGKVQMAPGTYVIKGGGVSVTGNGRIEDQSDGDGQGVFIFNACGGFPATTGTCGAISMSGNGRIELEKDTGGAWAGMSIWQPCENTQTLTVSGSGDHGGQAEGDQDGEFETSGTIYLPCAAVSVSGNGELEIEDGQLVADTVTVTGNGEIEVEWETSVSNVARIPALVE